MEDETNPHIIPVLQYFSELGKAVEKTNRPGAMAVFHRKFARRKVKHLLEQLGQTGQTLSEAQYLTTNKLNEVRGFIHVVMTMVAASFNGKVIPNHHAELGLQYFMKGIPERDMLAINKLFCEQAYKHGVTL